MCVIFYKARGLVAALVARRVGGGGGGGDNTLGRLDGLRLLVVIENSLFSFNILDALMMDVVDANDVVGQIGVVVVLIRHDSLRVPVVAVDIGNNCTVVSVVVVVLAQNGLSIIVVKFNISHNSWLLIVKVAFLATRHGWLSIAAVVGGRW